MGNQHSAAHAAFKPRKNVHWKSAGRPAAPGKPDIVPLQSDDEPNAVTLRWAAPAHDGGAPLLGFQVECNRLGCAEWLRTAPAVVARPELVLTGLQPPHRYQFRVAALNAVGRSDYGDLSDVLTVGAARAQPPVFLQHLEDVTALENDKTEFRVSFSGAPTPSVAWFKDDYEIFSSRRTAITTSEGGSVLVFHQTQASDEGEIKCTATNRAGHAVTRARLALEAAPRLRYPRQYEDGLLYEINETIFLKSTIVGKPTPIVEWRHDGLPIENDGRVEVTTTAKFSMLKIHSARRSDRGEYQVHASNSIGEDSAAFLVTVTAPPEPPRAVAVSRQLDRSVTLTWHQPADDGGCRIGNYVVEYFRTGWNVWLKATTSRQTSATLFDLIEGSEYRFRVKAESPYGMSAPSEESAAVRVPGRPADAAHLAAEARIISATLAQEEAPVSPACPAPAASPAYPASPVPRRRRAPPRETNEIMLVLYPEKPAAEDKAEKRKSFQLELEESLSPPPLSLSAPSLGAPPPVTLRRAASSSELLHERAMQRLYCAVAMREEREERTTRPRLAPNILINTDSVEDKEYRYDSPSPAPAAAPATGSSRWQTTSFDEDYTASTASTDGDYSDEEEEGSLAEDARPPATDELADDDTYSPRHKLTRDPTPPVAEPAEPDPPSPSPPPLPLPLPDPQFVPKPILKKRDIEVPDPPTYSNNLTASKRETKADKPKKEEKITLFKKFTKMPVQKPFPFPKLLSKKGEVRTPAIAETPKVEKKIEPPPEKMNDEGRTVIDYYGSIVKEYGGQRRAATPTQYLNTEELKTAAEQQQQQQQVAKTAKDKKLKAKKPAAKTTRAPGSPVTAPAKRPASAAGHTGPKDPSGSPGPASPAGPPGAARIELHAAERATLVIPIDYGRLQRQARVNVRSAIDYAVDSCLLLLAFWVYLFKDERLAVPLLLLIIYRQLRDTLMRGVPAWVARHTPGWLKKTS